MLGWDIIVRRQRENRTSPIANPSLFGFGSLEVAAIASSPVVARWQAHTGGLGWLDALVKKGKALLLATNSGYPYYYAAKAEDVVPIIIYNAPHAKTPGELGAEDRIKLAKIEPDEWLFVEAWDQS